MHRSILSYYHLLLIYNSIYQFHIDNEQTRNGCFVPDTILTIHKIICIKFIHPLPKIPTSKSIQKDQLDRIESWKFFSVQSWIYWKTHQRLLTITKPNHHFSLLATDEMRLPIVLASRESIPRCRERRVYCFHRGENRNLPRENAKSSSPCTGSNWFKAESRSTARLNSASGRRPPL